MTFPNQLYVQIMPDDDPYPVASTEIPTDDEGAPVAIYALVKTGRVVVQRWYAEDES